MERVVVNTDFPAEVIEIVYPAAQGVQGEKGEKGAKGDKGDRGPKGDRGYDGKDGVVFEPYWVGTTLCFKNSEGKTNPDPKDLKGEKGDTGPKGEQGEAGADGEMGGYYIPVFEGTVLSFVNYMGEQNPEPVDLKGERGFSPYELAVQNGFVGTEEQWLESLKGQDGFRDIDEVLKVLDEKTDYPTIGEVTPQTFQEFVKEIGQTLHLCDEDYF